MYGKVLLVESSHNYQQTVAKALIGEQIETLCTDDSEAAVCLLNESLPDMVISDILLPKKNGFALCQYVREEPEFQSLPVILLDSHFDTVNQRVALAVGASAYLSKPFEPSELLAIVRQLLQNRENVDDKEIVSPRCFSHNNQTLSATCDFAGASVESNTEQMQNRGKSTAEVIITANLPKTTRHNVRKGRQRILWMTLAVTILLAIALIITLRPYTSGYLMAGNASSFTEPIVNASPITKEQDRAPQQKQETTIGIPKAEKSEGRAKQNMLDGIPRNDSAKASDQPTNTPHALSRNGRTARPDTSYSPWQRNMSEVKAARPHVGKSRRRDFVENGGKMAEWVGKKVSNGVKQMGKVLKKFF